MSAVPSIESRPVVRPYIALVRAEVICPPREWFGGLAVYYDPGSVSLSTGETLSYCFLQIDPYDEPWVWSQQDVTLTRTLTERALSLVEKERRRLETHWPVEQATRLPPGMCAVAQDVQRLLYFEPEHVYLKPMRQLLSEGRELTRNQIATVQQIKAERGGLQGLRHRQLTQWRLRRLAEIELESPDRTTVTEFQHQAKAALGLKRTREPVIGALEAKYEHARYVATEQRTRQIMAELQMERAANAGYQGLGSPPALEGT